LKSNPAKPDQLHKALAAPPPPARVVQAAQRGFATPPGLIIRSGGGTTQHRLFMEEDMSFRPLHDRILVRRVSSEEKTKGGIIIPDTAKEKPQEGEVIAAGPGARNDAGQIQALDVKVGDRILFGKWSGTEIKIDGEELLIMKESDVMGIIEAQGEKRQAA
jgi:chaperonin GroES